MQTQPTNMEIKVTPFLTYADFIIARRTLGVRHFYNRFFETGQTVSLHVARMIEAGAYLKLDECFGHKVNRSFVCGFDDGATAVVWAELTALGYVIEETVAEKNASAKAAGLSVIVRI
jgi:hypothetical protein